MGVRIKALKPAGSEPLTPRELEVLKLIAQGRKVPEIASELHIAPGTVHGHRGNIMGKLGLHNMQAAIKHVYEHGIITRDVVMPTEAKKTTAAAE